MEIKQVKHQACALRRWQSRIEERQRSGLGITEYCRRTGYAGGTMRRWMDILATTPVQVAARPLEFIRVTVPSDVPASAGASGVILEAGGVRVRLERSFDDDTLVRALRAIAEAASC